MPAQRDDHEDAFDDADDDYDSDRDRNELESESEGEYSSGEEEEESDEDGEEESEEGSEEEETDDEEDDDDDDDDDEEDEDEDLDSDEDEDEGETDDDEEEEESDEDEDDDDDDDEDEDDDEQEEGDGYWDTDNEDDNDDDDDDDEEETDDSEEEDDDDDDDDDEEETDDSDEEEEEGSDEDFEDEPGYGERNALVPTNVNIEDNGSEFDADERLPDDEEDEHDEEKAAASRRAIYILVLCCCILVLIAVGVVLALLFVNKDDDDKKSTKQLGPTIAPTPISAGNTTTPTMGPTRRTLPSRFEYTAVSDTYVRGGNFATQAFGTQNFLSIRDVASNPSETSYALLTFDLTRLPSLDNLPEDISGVSLQLEHQPGSTGASPILQVRRIVDMPNVDLEKATWESLNPTIKSSSIQDGKKFQVFDTDFVVNVDISDLLGLTTTTNSRSRRQLRASQHQKQRRRQEQTEQNQLSRTTLKQVTLQIISDSNNAVGTLFQSRDTANGSKQPKIVLEFTGPIPTPAPTLSPRPTTSPRPSASPTISQAPSVTSQPTSGPTSSPTRTTRPTATAKPTSSPTLSQQPTRTARPSATPTDSFAPTRAPTGSPSSSAQPSACSGQFEPELIFTQPPPRELPDGAVSIIAQSGTQATVRVRQIFTNADLDWMAPSFLDQATNNQVCNKQRNVAFQAVNDYTIRCLAEQFGIFDLIVNDANIPTGPVLSLPDSCTTGESDDLPNNQIMYRFRIPCKVPACTSSPAPTKSLLPSAAPTTTRTPTPMPTSVPTALPTIFTTSAPTAPKTSSPTQSAAPSECIEQFRPQLSGTFGTKVDLPDGAVTIINQGGNTVRLKITQLWSTSDIFWIAPYYQIGGTGTYKCEKNNEIAPLEELEEVLDCFQGFVNFNVVLNDSSFPSGPVLGDLPGCADDFFDIRGKKVGYSFNVQCREPTCELPTEA